jgi:hypothetical protein
MGDFMSARPGRRKFERRLGVRRISDGNFTAALGVPTPDGLGIDGDGAHTEWEHGLLSSIEPRPVDARAARDLAVGRCVPALRLDRVPRG